MALNEYLDEIKVLMEQGNSYQTVGETIKGRFGVNRGASEANVKKFCLDNGNGRRQAAVAAGTVPSSNQLLAEV